jgi:hypothetical protein
MDGKRYWFKRKRYGWGWTPVTWEGWGVVLLSVGLVLVAAALLPAARKELALPIFIVMLLSAGTLIYFGYTKGPKPRWRWGSAPTDDPDEDI